MLDLQRGKLRSKALARQSSLSVRSARRSRMTGTGPAARNTVGFPMAFAVDDMARVSQLSTQALASLFDAQVLWMKDLEASVDHLLRCSRGGAEPALEHSTCVTCDRSLAPGRHEERPALSNA